MFACTVRAQRYVCVPERQRERKRGICIPLWLREGERNWMCVCTHETHFTQLSTCILHPADEVSEKVAVRWQIKSASCKASINLAFPSE